MQPGTQPIPEEKSAVSLGAVSSQFVSAQGILTVRQVKTPKDQFLEMIAGRRSPRRYSRKLMRHDGCSGSQDYTRSDDDGRGLHAPPASTLQEPASAGPLRNVLCGSPHPSRDKSAKHR